MYFARSHGCFYKLGCSYSYSVGGAMAMTMAVEQSPTKQITETLSRLNLYSGEGEHKASSRSQSETLTSAKNHLHIPKLIFNKGFADESKVGENTEFLNHDAGMASDSTVEEEGDTVIHNTENADNTLPDWMAVKLKMQSTTEDKQGTRTNSGIAKPKLVNNTTKPSTHLKPRLVNSVTDSESESEMLRNETWEEMKKQYGINYSDDSPSSSEEENMNTRNEDTIMPRERQVNDTSAYSFQDMDDFRIISEGQLSSSNGTKKVTSFKPNYVDSPMAPPKIAKSLNKPKFILSDVTNVQSTKENINETAQVELITPVDQNMKFDADEGKWIFPHDHLKLKEQNDENILIIDEIEKPVILESLDDNAMKTTVEFDTQQVTNVSQLDLSFSESRKSLISALTSAIRPKTNWDEIQEIDISNKKLVTVKSLEEFLPRLTEIKLDFNKLTTIEGLSTCLQHILLSHNKISDHFLNFKPYTYLHKIDISYNKLTNMKLFQDLKNLRELNLSNNGITNLVELPSLQILNLSYNEIQGDLNFNELKFPDLQELDLSGNKLSDVVISNLKELRILKLRDNELTRLEFGSNLTKLKKLNIIGNKGLKHVSTNELMNLRSLSFEGVTKLRGEFPNLISLMLINDIKLKSLFNESLKINKHLLSIALNECLVDSKILLNKIYNNFPHLQRINLNNNEIKETFSEMVLYFEKFKDLKQINLIGNPIMEGLNEDEKLFKLMIKKLTS